MRILAHGPLQEFDLAAVPLQLLQQHHLVNVVAGQPVGRRDEHAVQPRRRDRVAQPVQAWPLQTRAAVAVVAEDVLLAQVPPLPSMGRHMRPQALQLLLSALRLRLARRRDARVHANSLHGPPPASLLGSSAPPLRLPH